MAEKTKKNPRKKTKADKKTREETIRERAYEIFEKRGRKHGKDLDDWLEAERTVGEEKRK